MPHRLLAALALAVCWNCAAHAQAGARGADEDTVFLVAQPGFVDKAYRQSVLIAAPIPSGGHVGVILNRPTAHSLNSFFPDQASSRQVRDPVRYGGPFSPDALVAVLRARASPGEGALPLMKDLYIVFHARTIDRIIESTPNRARYYVGYVGWRPGELQAEIDRGLWAVARADRDTVFREDTRSLWEELIEQSRRLQAGTGGSRVGTGGSMRVPPYPPVASLKD